MILPLINPNLPFVNRIGITYTATIHLFSLTKTHIRMKKTIYLSIVLLATLISCSKDDDSSSSVSAGFSISEDGAANAKADSSFYSIENGSAFIYAFQGELDSNGISDNYVKLMTLVPQTGTFTIDGGDAYVWYGQDLVEPKSGSITVTSNTNGKASGSFDLVLEDNTTIKGTFTDIEVR